jgi:hypothetical protein
MEARPELTSVPSVSWMNPGDAWRFQIKFVLFLSVAYQKYVVRLCSTVEEAVEHISHARMNDVLPLHL